MAWAGNAPDSAPHPRSDDRSQAVLRGSRCHPPTSMLLKIRSIDDSIPAASTRLSPKSHRMQMGFPMPEAFGIFCIEAQVTTTTGRSSAMASVLITGTSKGIGLETALHLGRAGHTVYATMRNPAGAPELGRRAASEMLPIHVSAMDVDSDESVAAAMAEIERLAGTVDVLVNNAGIARDGSVEELALEDFRAVMETNYFGALRCTKAVVGAMRKRRSGCIVNVTSIAGKLSTSPLGAYAASKFALEALSEALAQEMKTFGVRVAIIEPGIIDTPMARGIGEMNVETPYPQARRLQKIFLDTLADPAGPRCVAEKIREIIETDTWQLRHVVGPSGAPTLAWRASMSDEEFVALNGAPDDESYARLAAEYGARPVVRGK